MNRALAALTVALTIAAALAAACGNPDAERAQLKTGATITATARPSATTGPASPTPEAASPTPVAASPTPAAATPTSSPLSCTGHCPGGANVTSTPTRTPQVGDDGVPRVPPLRALNFSPGETFGEYDLAARGIVDSPGRGPMLAVSVVIPSIGVDAAIVAAVVGPDGDMPEPGSPSVVAWYDFSQWPGLGGVPLSPGNTIMSGDFRQGPVDGVFVQLASVTPGEIIVLHLNDGRRLFYRVEFNKTVAVDGIPWEDVTRATADESLTLITASGSVVGAKYTHRRIVWSRRVNCTLLESPETPTRAPYVTCEQPT